MNSIWIKKACGCRRVGEHECKRGVGTTSLYIIVDSKKVVANARSPFFLCRYAVGSIAKNVPTGSRRAQATTDWTMVLCGSFRLYANL